VTEEIQLIMLAEAELDGTACDAVVIVDQNPSHYGRRPGRFVANAETSCAPES
jgi:hypothetical protein